MKIELNPKFKEALELMENTSKNIFITGRAGTGKSTLLSYFRDTTSKNAAILASTGVAAVNIGGQTIHSFFGFKPDINPSSARNKKVSDKFRKIISSLDMIIIDEISMVRADLLDCVDIYLRKITKKRKPFGGLQMVFFGDLYQLPPVVTSEEKDFFTNYYRSPYFFSSKVFESIDIEIVELDKIYRQTDDVFIEILNKVRNKTIQDKDIDILNKRVVPDFEPSHKDRYIHLVGTNRQAEMINSKMLAALKGDEYVFKGYIEGDFDPKSLPAPLELRLKRGAQVMMVNNDKYNRWVNGTIGYVVDFVEDEKGNAAVQVELADGDVVDVSPNSWEIFRYIYDEETGAIDTEVVGTYTQFPIILSWAITIHKSQGKTFDKVIIDIPRTFAHGQMYVALSRCTSLDGLVLKRPLKKSSIWMDWQVMDFLTSFQYRKSEQNMPLEDKVKLIQKAIDEGKNLEIVYLKQKDEKSQRIITPQYVGEMEYAGRTYIGVEGYCHIRKDIRVFRVDRILEISIL